MIDRPDQQEENFDTTDGQHLDLPANDVSIPSQRHPTNLCTSSLQQFSIISDENVVYLFLFYFISK